VTVVEIRNRRDSRGIGSTRDAMLAGARREILDLPEAQPIIERLAAACCTESTIDLAEHILLVARVVVEAKRHPKTRFAPEATL
jgi:hypothetical protein